MPEFTLDLTLDPDLKKPLSEEVSQGLVGELDPDLRAATEPESPGVPWGDVGMEALGATAGIGNLITQSLAWAPLTAAAGVAGPFVEGGAPRAEEFLYKNLGLAEPPPVEGTPERAGYDVVTEPVGKALEFVTRPALEEAKFAARYIGRKFPSLKQDPSFQWTMDKIAELGTFGALGVAGAKVKGKVGEVRKAGETKAWKESVEQYKIDEQEATNIRKMKAKLEQLKAKTTKGSKTADAIFTLQNHMDQVLTMKRDLQIEEGMREVSPEALAQDVEQVRPEAIVGPISGELPRTVEEGRPTGPAALKEIVPRLAERQRQVVARPSEVVRPKVEGPIELTQKAAYPAQMPQPITVEPRAVEQPELRSKIKQSQEPIIAPALEPVMSSTGRKISTDEINRTPKFLAELETRMREIAKLNDLDRAAERARKLMAEVSETAGVKMVEGQPMVDEALARVDRASELAGRFLEHVREVQRVKQIKQTSVEALRKAAIEEVRAERLAKEAEKEQAQKLPQVTTEESGSKLDKLRAARERVEAGKSKAKLSETSKKLLLDESGSVEPLSPEFEAVVREAVVMAKKARESFEKFLERNGLDKSLVVAMRKVSEDMDRERKVIESVPAKQAVGKVVRQRKLDSYVDPNTGHRESRWAPAVLDYQEAVVKGLDKPFSRSGLGVAAQTFDYMGEPIKEMVWRRRKQEEAALAREKTAFHRELKEWKKSLSRKDIEDIETETFLQQTGGEELLRNMEMAVPTVPLSVRNPKASKVYELMRDRYDELGQRWQTSRKAAGQKMFKWEPFYAPFIVDLVAMGKDISMVSADRMAQDLYSHRTTVELRHSKSRKAKPGDRRVLVTDPFTLLERYNDAVLDPIYHAETLSWVKELLAPWKEPVTRSKLDKKGQPVLDSDGKPKIETARSLFQLNEEAAKFLEKWRHSLTGELPSSEIPLRVQKLMKAASRNVVWSTMAYNVSSYLNQSAALVQAGAVVGKYLLPGVYDLVKSAERGSGKWEFMMKNSNVMPQRFGQFDATVAEALTGQGLKGMYSRGQRALAKPGMVPVSVIDMGSAAVTWFAAYRQGMKLFKGELKKAVNYADDVVVKTQASGLKSDIAPIQRGPVGALMTTLQTFALSNWDFLARDIFGYKNPNVKTPQRVGRVLRFLIGMSIVNYVWEDLIGIHSPMPNPVGAVADSVKRGDTSVETGWQLLLELVEPVPLIGSVAKYKSELGGPVVDALTTALTERDPARVTEALARLAGIPGVSQVKKSLRAVEQGGAPLDVVTGGKPGQVKKKSSSGTPFRGSFNRFSRSRNKSKFSRF